jgi:tetratricopeptide (TPR) repeat protein
VSAAEQGDYLRAGHYLQQSRAEWEESGDTISEAMSLAFLGEIDIVQNDFARAERLFELALTRFKEVQDFPFLGMVLRRLGQIAVYQEDLLKAARFIREGLVYNWNIHDYRGTGACLAALATVSVAQGETERAIKLFGAVEAILDLTRIPLLPFDRQQYEYHASQLRDRVDRKMLAKTWSEGKALSLDEAISFALKEQKG